MISQCAKLQVDRGASLRIGSQNTLEWGVLMAVRKGGQLSIGSNVYLNRNCSVIARESILIEDGVTIGPGCCIYDHDHDIKDRGSFISKAVVVKKNAWIGAGCIILKGVTIGSNAVVAAGTVVTKDVPADTVIRTKFAYVYKDVEENV